jgi:thiosulfate/3-mercaptopyruvate sulfurtransferase
VTSALISVDELATLLPAGQVVVVDCRFSLKEPDQGFARYREGHIPGAVYAHLDRDLSGPVVPGRTGRHPLPDPEALARRFAEWGIDATRHVIAYDDDVGAFAARLWWLLHWLGHDSVSVLDGGFAAWTAAGLPGSTETPDVTRASFVAHVRSELIADANEVEAVRTHDDHRLLDARDGARFRGEVEPIDPVAGHIPGARSLPFLGHTDAGHMRPAADVLASFAAVLGHVPAENAIAYCGSGVTAAHLVLAADHAGLGRVRLYPGSWSEWITDASRPVATGS